MIKHKHQQLYDLLCAELRKGTWPCGAKLPNLKELACQYDVSINVASKAVELLKEAKLVSAKVGDGIYSETSGQASIVEFRYSGERLYGQYRDAKELYVLVEDNAEWQLIYWDAIFAEITNENPDIELKVSYNRPGGFKDCKFDLGLGSVEFLAQSGFSPEESMPASVMNDFYGEIYDGMLMRPSDFNWQGVECYLPYGFINYSLLSANNYPEPEQDENVLDYIERLSKNRKEPLGYGIHNCRSLLTNCGLEFFDHDHKFSIRNPRQTLDVFKRIRALYHAGHLIWPHGRVADYEQIYLMNSDQPIRIVEYASNRCSQSERRKFMERGLKLMRYPADRHPVYIPEVVAINRHSYFPEECLRIVNKLLEPASQKRAKEHCVFQPIRPELFKNEPYLLEEFKCAKPALFIPDANILKTIYYFINWELYYYLNGKRNDNVINFIEQKIKYYQQAKEKENE